MKFDLSILFDLGRAQSDIKALAHVSLRITVNGGHTELSTGRKIELEK